MSCPEPLLLRALAEDSLGPGEEWVTSHAAECARCQRHLKLARQEEASLRAALPAEPPADLLKQTLAAVAAEARPPKARRRAASGGGAGWAPGFALLLTALGLAWFLGGEDPAPPRAPTPQPRSTPKPAPKTQAPTPARKSTSEPGPKQTTPKARPTDPPLAPPEVVVKAPLPKPLPEPRPDPKPDPKPLPQPPPEETPKPPSSERGPPLLARVRSGKLAQGKLRYGPGQALPRGVQLTVLGRTAEVESPGALALTFAPRSRFRIEAVQGRRIVHVERGRLLARTAGRVPYALVTPEGRVTPVGTRFLLTRRSARTRVATLEGALHFRVGDTRLLVRAGFEASARRGKLSGASALWRSPAKALAWLPRKLRPALPRPRRVLATFSFERGPEGFGKGTWRRGGAHGSRASLAGLPHPQHWRRVVELEREGLVTLGPDLWVEASVRVSRKAQVVLQLWDTTRKENWSHFATVEPGQWVTLAAPLRDFTDPAGKARGRLVKEGNVASSLNVFAGKGQEALELWVDDLRFVR